MKRSQDSKCAYSIHDCSRSTYRDYDYCFKHISEDKSSPFIMCQHLSKYTQRRCRNPALKAERSSIPALCELHKNCKTHSAKRKVRSYLSKCADYGCSKSLCEQTDKIPDRYSVYEQERLWGDKETSDASDVEMQTNNKWLVKNSVDWNTGESDIDVGIMTARENIFQMTDVVTAEEALVTARDNLVQMQALYIDQFKQLQKELVEKRHMFLTGKLHNSVDKFSSKERKKMYAMNNFRCCGGGEKYLLSRQAKQKHDEVLKSRHSVTDPSIARCSHVSRNCRCKLSCLPYTKFCVLHIVDDPLQVLFKSCSHPSCKTPTCLLTSDDEVNFTTSKLHCKLHITEQSNKDYSIPVFDPVKDQAQLQCVKCDATDSTVSIPIQSLPNVGGINKKVSCKHDNDEVNSERLKPESCMEFDGVDDSSNRLKSVDQMNDSEKESSDVSEPLVTLSQTDAGRSSTSSHGLDVLQPGQCYVMQSFPSDCKPELHLQVVKGLSSDGVPEVGDGVVFKQQVGHLDLSMTSNKKALNILSEERSPNTAVLMLKSNQESKEAKVKHHGSVMSVSLFPGNKVESTTVPLACPTSLKSSTALSFSTSTSTQTFVESRTLSDGVSCEVTSKQYGNLERMPPLAPLHAEPLCDQVQASKPFKTECKGSCIETRVSLPETVHEDPSAHLNDDDESKLAASIQEDMKSTEKFANVTHHNRKPSCPDEEAAVASLLSLCSATCSSDSLGDNQSN